MKLYIQVENGVTINHPAFEDNLLEAFGTIPKDWVPFSRISQPSPKALSIGVYQVPVCTYVLDNDGISWKDQWSVRDMTQEEKTKKIDEVLQHQPYPSWTFNEQTCHWEAPIPYPNDENIYVWNESTLSYVPFVNDSIL